jgi:hypothetical protein
VASDHATATTDPDLITFVTISVTARQQGANGQSTTAQESDEGYLTTTVSEEVRLRTRG